MAKIAAVLLVVGTLLLPLAAAAAQNTTPPGVSLSGPPPGASQPAAVKLPMPDLVVTEITFDHVTLRQEAKPKTCYSFYFGFTITNKGDAPSLANAKVLQDATDAKTGQYVNWATWDIGPLAPNATYAQTPQKVIMQYWCVGDPYKVKVRITVDPPDATHPGGAVAESDETNNRLEREFKAPIAAAAPLPQKKP